MAPSPPLGIVLHAIGGLSSATFYVPSRKVKEWSWETYWLTQAFFSWFLMPILVAWLTMPDLGAILAESDKVAMGWSFFFGAVYGIGGLTFGLGLRYLGFSLNYAVALGFTAAFGTTIPPLYQGKAAELFTKPSGWVLWAGIAVGLAGIAVCGYAGYLKEQNLSEEEKKKAVKEFAFRKGIPLAILAGTMSACFAVALDFGEPIADVAAKQIADAAGDADASDILKNNPVFIFAMGGAFLTNLIWCLILGVKNRTLHEYTDARRIGPAFYVNYALAALGGALWYFQFFFYGMGKSLMGEKYDFSSWSIHMIFIIFFSSLYGLAFKEWKGIGRRAHALIFGGLAVLLLAIATIGYANYLGVEEKAAEEEKAKQAGAADATVPPST